MDAAEIAKFDSVGTKKCKWYNLLTLLKLDNHLTHIYLIARNY
jgi:hypothetical protein